VLELELCAEKVCNSKGECNNAGAAGCQPGFGGGAPNADAIFTAFFKKIERFKYNLV